MSVIGRTDRRVSEIERRRVDECSITRGVPRRTQIYYGEITVGMERLILTT